MDMPWTVANDTPVWLKPRRTVYFLHRWKGVTDPSNLRGCEEEQFEDKAGRIRTWRTSAEAQRKCDALNMNGASLIATPPDLNGLLHEALRYEAAAFNDDEPVSGADLLDWFAEWRLRVTSVLAGAEDV